MSVFWTLGLRVSASSPLEQIRVEAQSLREDALASTLVPGLPAPIATWKLGFDSIILHHGWLSATSNKGEVGPLIQCCGAEAGVAM